MPLNIIVVGAGIGGLTASLALRKAGHSILVLEKHTSKREVGYAVTIPPNSSRILRSLGLDFHKARMTLWNGLDMIRADQHPPEIFSTPHIDAEKIYGAPHMALHRVDLWECLFEMAISAGVKLREGANVVAYDADSGEVVLDSGEKLKADLIVAADGVRSKAHRWVLGEERPATLSQLHSLRFVVPTETLLNNPKTATLGFGETRARVYYGSTNRRGIFQSPCRDNTLQNFGVYDIQLEHQNADPTNWTTKATRAMALAILEREGFDDTVLEIVRVADESDMYLWRVADRDPLEKFQEGKLALLGDASHPMRPDHGQGATQAIEDAGVLGVILTGANTGDDLSKRLQLWERLRKPRAGAAQLLSRSEGLNFGIAEDNLGKLMELLGKENLPEMNRPAIFAWFFRYDCVAEAKKAMQELLRSS